MTWVYEALEVADGRGRSLDRYRVGRWCCEDPDHIESLCGHVHKTPDEALNCPDVARVIEREFKERIVETEHRFS